MASKSSGGISLSTIIFLVIMYNFVFSDDDEEVNVTVEEEAPIVQQDEGIPKEAFEKLAEDLNQLKDDMIEAGKEFKESLETESGGEVIDATDWNKKQEPQVVEEPKEEPKEDKPQEEEWKSL